MKHIARLFTTNPFFDNIPSEKMTNILEYFTMVSVKKGKILYDIHTQANTIFIIVHGEIYIYFNNQEGKLELSIVSQSGDIIGETAFLSHTKHSARAEASIDSTLLKLNKKNFSQLIQAYPQISMNLGRIEATRFRNRMKQQKKPLALNNFVTHLYFGDQIHASLISLNIALSIIQSNPNQKILYLHLSREETIYHQIFKSNSNKKDLNHIAHKIQDYVKYNTTDVFTRHKTGLFSLPYSNNIILMQFLENHSITHFLSFCKKKFDYIFCHVDTSYLNKPIVRSLIRQSNKILIGTAPNLKQIHATHRGIQIIEKHIPKMKEHVQYYLDHISNHTLPSPHNKESILALRQIEEEFNIRFQFKLKGTLSSASSLFNGQQLFVQKSPATPSDDQLKRSFLSLGRYLTHKTIGLAFGGGGARALAAIGVLRVMEEEDIQVDYVVGTSMGALVAALAALGNNSHDIEIILCNALQNDKAILDYSIPLLSFFRGKKMQQLIFRHFSYTYIEDMNIPFCCIATDLVTGQEYRFDRGPLAIALLASMSVPVVFPPVRWQGRFLIDGGAINNLPGNVLKDHHIRYSIGINPSPIFDNKLSEQLESLQHILGDPLGRTKPKIQFKQLMLFILKTLKRPFILTIANKAMLIEGAALIKYQINFFDHLINLDVGNFHIFDFHHTKDLIHLGIQTAKSHIQSIKNDLHNL